MNFGKQQWKLWDGTGQNMPNQRCWKGIRWNGVILAFLAIDCLPAASLIHSLYSIYVFYTELSGLHEVLRRLPVQALTDQTQICLASARWMCHVLQTMPWEGKHFHSFIIPMKSAYNWATWVFMTWALEFTQCLATPHFDMGPRPTQVKLDLP